MKELSQGDKQVVYNMRHEYKEHVAVYSDEHIAKAWRVFSQSDDYPDGDFLSWLDMDLSEC